MSFPTTKLSLPTLNWKYDELEPHISGKINEIHHTKHHQAYVNGYNSSIEQLAIAQTKNDVKKTLDLIKLINFNAGGYTNHILFFNNLSPVAKEGGKLPSSDSNFAKQVISQYGSFEKLIEATNVKLASIQGSGWAFIVKNKSNGGQLDIITTANQDPTPEPFVPLIAIDAWEHAYYLQYQNVKLDYFKAIWNVISWKEAERRFDESSKL